MKIILYITTLLIAIWPVANIFQTAICALMSRLFFQVSSRQILLINWPWYIKTLSFSIALLFWLGVNEVWKYLTNTPIPMVLAGAIYVVVALYTKSKKAEMNYIFRTNKINEVYATILFFIYQLFIAEGVTIF